MTYYARPITGREDAAGVTTWLWADNDGLRCGDALPPSPVPTGHVWGWGPDVRVYLREDVAHPTRGVLVSEVAIAGSQAATIMPPGSGRYPSIVTDRRRFLRCASAEDQRRFDELDLDVLVLISPTQVVLVADKAV